jgi:hypothetical protein
VGDAILYFLGVTVGDFQIAASVEYVPAPYRVREGRTSSDR